MVEGKVMDRRHDEMAIQPPEAAWQEPVCDFIFECTYQLRGAASGARALAWLHARKLTDDTLRVYHIGYNPDDLYVARHIWGLPPAQNQYGRPKQLWLPRGIVIPWFIDGDVWGIHFRRPTGEPRYYWLPGGTLALYNAESLTYGKPAVLLEGELDALTIAQEAGELVAVVASGGTDGARYTRWIARLAMAAVVLVAYDHDEAGEQAARYWLATLPNARRWRPYWSDANAMAQDGVGVAEWIRAGLA
jgi:hypothetical protein